jgi:uncharacterized circularly permuted ATP-grasp superfamily protein
VTYELVGDAVWASAPTAVDPLVVVLTDGPDSAAHFEHMQAAHRLGATLATLADLQRDGDGLCVKLPDGELRPVDIVYRRTNEDRLRGDDGEPTDVARMLLEPWLSGRIGLVNAYGTGVGDDKFVHSCVEDCIGFYLDEEPLVRSVPTRTVASGDRGAPTVDELRTLVVKPRHGHGGAGVVIGAHAETHDLDRLASELAADPEGYICQPIIALSRHPTVIDGRLEPRHIDLRAFAFTGRDDDVRLIPGGLTRVALDADTLVVNSSQKGGGKDTWIVD